MNTKMIVSGLIVACGLAFAVNASADEGNKFRVGVSGDVGVPSGASVGLLVSPCLPWLKLGVAGNWNYVGEGLSGHFTLDPFRFPLGLTLTGEAGGFFPGNLPVSNPPSLAYTYESALLGVEAGKRTGFRFYLRGGITHMNLNMSNFSNAFTLPSGTTVGNPSMELVAPAAKLGFDWLF